MQSILVLRYKYINENKGHRRIIIRFNRVINKKSHKVLDLLKESNDLIWVTKLFVDQLRKL